MYVHGCEGIGNQRVDVSIDVDTKGRKQNGIQMTDNNTAPSRLCGD